MQTLSHIFHTVSLYLTRSVTCPSAHCTIVCGKALRHEARSIIGHLRSVDSATLATSQTVPILISRQAHWGFAFEWSKSLSVTTITALRMAVVFTEHISRTRAKLPTEGSPATQRQVSRHPTPKPILATQNSSSIPSLELFTAPQAFANDYVPGSHV